MSDRKVYLVNGSRTPIGSFGKSLRSVAVENLLTHTFVQTLKKTQFNQEELDGIIAGHGYQSPYAPNTTRVAALAANISATVPAMTVQRQCGSGMEAVHVACEKILSGRGEAMLAGGAESMSTIPYLIPGSYRWNGFVAKNFKLAKLWSRPTFFVMADNGIAPRHMLKDMKTVYMSATAQRLADTYGITREEADKYALRSQELARKAIDSGRFDSEIDAFLVSNRGFFSKDEHPRQTSLEKLAKLSPVMGQRDITAGNSSGINDGACCVLVVSGAKLQKMGSEPLAQIIDWTVAGVDPEQMGLGPVAAITKLLERTGLSLKDIDLFEINEAFAAQYLACEKLLKLDREKVNVNGGAIALGHPIGMSGTRVLLTLANELKNRNLKRGIASLCIGGGMGIATLIERV
jgi:acetyl-CoA C-acetyltransferase